MESNHTPPAEKTFCVYADRRVFQQVDAMTAEEAHRLAQLYPGDFEPCTYGIENFEMCPFVMDLESGEDVRVGSPAATCKTCGSEVVETVNESNFRDGECGACEYVRYTGARRSHETLCDLIDLAESVAANWENGRGLADAVNNLARTAREAKTVLNDAHGNAA